MSYMPNAGPGLNLLTNGLFEIDQLNEGSAVTLSSGTAGYGVDQWQGFYSGLTGSPVVTLQRTSTSPSLYHRSLTMTVSTAGTCNTNTKMFIRQPIEGNFLTGLGWGTVAAQPLALAFWFQQNVGNNIVYGGTISDGSSDSRSYSFLFTSFSSGTWERKVIIIPGDTNSGSWTNVGTANRAMDLTIWLDCGDTNATLTPGTWTASGLQAPTGINNTFGGTNSNAASIAGCKLEIGKYSTPFASIDNTNELARCQRYVEKSYNTGVAIGTNTTVGAWASLIQVLSSSASNFLIGPASFRVTKVATPSLTAYSPATGASGKVRDAQNNADVAASVSLLGMNQFYIGAGVSSATTIVSMQAHWVAKAQF